MKRTILTLNFIFLLISVTLFSQTSKKGPIIKFNNLIHDYGTIYQGADGSCEFRFTNEVDDPLIISAVRSSCGCTIPRYPKDPILPGQTNVIKVTYDTKRMGTISKNITVTSNASDPTIVLSIKGNVIQKPNEILPEKEINQGYTPSAN